MPDTRPMTPEELKNFEEREVQHTDEDREPAGPASESNEAPKRDREPPAVPLPNPD
jgi:hypothetical protein